jgi:hypothetical protein
MKIDEFLLIAYVDGKLAPREHSAVEKAIDASADLAEASCCSKRYNLCTSNPGRGRNCSGLPIPWHRESLK